MAGAFDQIAAGQHRLRRAFGKRKHRLIAQIKQFPQADAAADVERESRACGPAPCRPPPAASSGRHRDRRCRWASCVHRTHRGRPDKNARRPATRPAAWRWRGPRPTSAPMPSLGICGNVRRHEGAERRLELEAAGQLQAAHRLASPAWHGRRCSRRHRKCACPWPRRPGPVAARVVVVEPDRRRQQPTAAAPTPPRTRTAPTSFLQPGHWARDQPFLIL